MQPPASFKKSIPTEQPDTRQRRTVARFMFLSRTPIMEPAAATPVDVNVLDQRPTTGVEVEESRVIPGCEPVGITTTSPRPITAILPGGS